MKRKDLLILAFIGAFLALRYFVSLEAAAILATGGLLAAGAYYVRYKVTTDNPKFGVYLNSIYRILGLTCFTVAAMIVLGLFSITSHLVFYLLFIPVAMQALYTEVLRRKGFLEGPNDQETK